MTETKFDSSHIERKLADEMWQDILMLTAKAENDARVFLAHPEWHDASGVMLPPKKLKGGLSGDLDEAYKTLLPAAVKRVERIENVSDTMRRIRKVVHHIKQIMDARIKYDEALTPKAVESHAADFAIEMRDLGKNAHLPQDCINCLDIAFSIATNSPDNRREWRENAMGKDYVDKNEPVVLTR